MNNPVDIAELDEARTRLMLLAIGLEKRFGAEAAADLITSCAGALILGQLGRAGAAERLRLVALAMERGDPLSRTIGNA